MYSRGLSYSLNSDGGSYTVTGIGSCTDTDIIINATYNGLPVTAIGSSAFAGCESIKSVVIPEGVTSIESYTFYKYRRITSITLADSVTMIDEYAFDYAYDLSVLIIGSGMKAIYEGAFRDCSKLTDIYYNGTEEEWNAIYIDDDNGYDSYIRSATLHFNGNDHGVVGDPPPMPLA